MLNTLLEETLEYFKENNAPEDAIELIEQAIDNYETFEPLADGCYDMDGLAGEDNKTALDTMHNFGGYTWMLLCAAFYQLQHKSWSADQINSELNIIKEFKQHADSMSSIDVALSIIIPDTYKAEYEYKKLKENHYLTRRLESISITDPLCFVSGRYIQFEHYLHDKLYELAGGITTEQLAYLIYYKCQGGYLIIANGHQTKVLERMNASYGKKGFKHLETKFYQVSTISHRTKGTSRNIQNLQNVARLLNAYPNSMLLIEDDLKEAEINYMATEGGKWKG